MSNHDQRFKTLLPEYFDQFLRLFFPDWAARLDTSQVEWLPTEVFTDAPRGEVRLVDLVVRLPTRIPPTPTAEPGPWLVLVHVEIESKDAVAALHERMFDYWWLLSTKHRQPVLPIGLYLSVGFEGVGWSQHVVTFWGRELLRFEYAHVGLPALDAFEYVHREEVLGAALAALMHVPDDRRAELRATAEQRVAVSGENAARKRMLGECIDAYLPLEGAALEEYKRLLGSDTYTEARAMAHSVFEQGVQTGIERGIETGQRTLLLRLVVRRFGPLTDEVRRQIEALPAERLCDLCEAVLTAASLNDLGLEQP